MKRLVLVLVLVLATALATAGCLGGGGTEADAGTSSTDGSGSGPAPTGGSDGGGSGNATADSKVATLEEAPSWQVGEWWTVKVSDPFTGKSFTVKQVVASKHGSTYDVGLAKDDFRDSIVVFHWPALGEVSAKDLSFSIHNGPFKPAKFPMEKGQSWETTYYGETTYQAEVTAVDGKTAEVTMTDGDGEYINLTYDAEAETVTKLTDLLGLQVEVTDHGTGYTGDVVVPHGRSQYISARVAGAFGLGGPIFGLRPAPPTGSVDVSEPQASVALLAGSIPVNGQPSPGLYRETATTPGGTSLQLQTTGTDGLVYKYGHAEEAKGSWSFEHVAGGVGAAAAEIIAYEQLTVTVSDDAGSGGAS